MLTVDPVEVSALGRTGSGKGQGVDTVMQQIAATALMYGLTVVTRNVRHYEPTGVAVLNPFT